MIRISCWSELFFFLQREKRQEQERQQEQEQDPESFTILSDSYLFCIIHVMPLDAFMRYSCSYCTLLVAQLPPPKGVYRSPLTFHLILSATVGTFLYLDADITVSMNVLFIDTCWMIFSAISVV